MQKICNTLFFILLLSLYNSYCFSAVIMIPNGTTTGDIIGTSSADQITNEGIVNDEIFGNQNITNGSSGGSNEITNNNQVVNTVYGSQNFGMSSAGGGNIIINTGVVTQRIIGSENSGGGSSGGSNSIINTGTVDEIFGGIQTGASSSGGSNFIQNYGVVRNIYGVQNSISGFVSGLSIGHGNFNHIINSGIVTNDIYGAVNAGAFARGGSNKIFNYGSVRNIYGSWNYAGGYGHGNSIYNYGTANSIYGSQNQNFSSSGSHYINNAGIVITDIFGSDNYGPFTSSLFGNTIINSGNVGGSIYGDHYTHVVLGMVYPYPTTGGDDTIINSGIVNGSIDGGLGDDTIIHVGGQRVDGVSDGGEGSDTLGFQYFGDIIDDTHTKYVNFENLGIYGGINELIGNWDFSQGIATIDSGTLYINQTIIANAFFINSAGVLGGNGTITSNVTNYGTISPGNSIGTLNINGNLTFESGSVYIVELGRNGNADLIKVNGEVTINGGTLRTQVSRALYRNGEGWTVIEAGGGINGNFSTVTQPNSATLHLTAVNRGNILVLVVERTPYQDFGSSVSSMAVGAALDAIVPFAQRNNDSMKTFLTSLDFDYTAAGVSTVIEMLTPYIYDDISEQSKQTSVLYDDSLFRRTSLVHLASQFNQSEFKEENTTTEKGYDFWARALTNSNERSTQDSLPGYSSSTNGLVVGVDSNVFPEVLLGVSFGVDSSRVDGDGTTGSGDTNGFHAGLYGLAEFDSFYFDGSFTYSNYRVDVERPVISATGKQVTTSSDYATNGVGGRITAGYDTFVFDWLVTPLASLSANFLQEGSFSESDSGQPVLSGDSRSNTYIDSSLGVNTAKLYKFDTMSLLPKLELSWVHGFITNSRELDAEFSGYEDVPFEIHGRESGEDLMKLKTGGQLLVNTDLSFFLDYNLLANSDYTSQMLTLGLDWKF